MMTTTAFMLQRHCRSSISVVSFVRHHTSCSNNRFRYYYTAARRSCCHSGLVQHPWHERCGTLDHRGHTRTLSSTPTSTTLYTTDDQSSSSSSSSPHPEPPSQPPQPQPQQQQILLLRQAWHNTLQTNGWKYDPGQLEAAKRLERLQMAFADYDNQPILRQAMATFRLQQHKQRLQQPRLKRARLLPDDVDDENKDQSSSPSSPSSVSTTDTDAATSTLIAIRREECSPKNEEATTIAATGGGDDTHTIRHTTSSITPTTTDASFDGSSTLLGCSVTETLTTTTTATSPPLPPLPKQSPQHPPLPRVPRGLYLHGPVGTGKSMLMDTFFDLVQVSTLNSGSGRINKQKKQRWHFHAFMADIHQRIHALRNKSDNHHDDRHHRQDNPLPQEQHENMDRHDRSGAVAMSMNAADDDEDWPILHRVGFQLAQEMSLLCLDEFQITDVADAMILSQLLTVLLTSGVVIVTTSNRPPQDLYPDDVAGEFTFVVQNLLQRYCILHEMDSTMDYRQQQQPTSSSSCIMEASQPTSTPRTLATPFWINDQDDGDNDDTVHRRDRLRHALDDILAQHLLGGTTDIVYEPFDLPLGHGRCLVIPHAARVKILRPDHHHNGAVSPSSSSSSTGVVHVARMTFRQLCHDDSLLGASDYRALARHFDVVVVEEIPILNVSTGAAVSGATTTLATTPTTQDYNQAKRFVNLIDELYEAKTTALVCSSLQAMTPNQIFIRGGDDDNPVNDDHDLDDSKTSVVASDGATTIIDGVVSHGHTMVVNAGIRELQFASKRASSRLMEMTSHRWWQRKRIAAKKASSS